MKFCERKDLIDRQSYVAQYLSLASFTIGVTTMLGSDDLLAAFSCGTAFAWDGFFNRQTEQSVFSSVIDLIFNIAAFVFIGAWMPFSSFNNAELTLSVWRLIVIAILILLLRRLPIMLALYKWIPDVKTFREAVFSGHFGPIGVGAVFISTLAAESLPAAENPTEDQVEMLAATIQPIVAFMVLCSITIHGLSIPFFSLGRRVHSVSRTWSRHQSMDVGPEWATHTRRVVRPEDIIINRDSALERGDLNVITDEKLVQREALEDLEGKSEEGLPSSASSGSPLKPASDESGDRFAINEGRPDTAPDGEIQDAEWKEGSDLVVERRAGPGTDVEVEVVPGGAENDASDSHGETTIQNQYADADQTSIRMKDTTKRLGHADRGDLDQTISIAKESEECVEKVEDRTQKRVMIKTHSHPESPAESSSSHQRALTHTHSQPEIDDEDEGWTSDRSGPGSSIDGHRAGQDATEQSRRRSKSPKQKLSSKVLHVARRRNSIRRSLLGRTRSQMTPRVVISRPSISEDDVEDEERGRQLTVPTGPRPQHRRVSSLQTPEVSRSVSPTRSVRSIRFADDSTPTSIKQVAFDLP